MPLFLAGTVLLLFSGFPGLFAGRDGGGGEWFSTILVLAGSLLGGMAAVAALAAPATPALDLRWAVPGGAFALALDGISACFLLPLFLIAALGAVYGLGYWPQRRHPATGRQLRLFSGLLIGAMALVLTARNGILFLAAWEIMALAGFFLITTEEHKEEARRAGFIYLVATHTGTLALFALFGLLGRGTGSFAFPAAGSLGLDGATGTAIFLLALVGFGIKAGLMPLHVWLPGAHAAAPSHISALLSGVMIKTGIYGLVRITGFFHVIPPWWGWLVLLAGAVSGVMGVAFAIAQHDIKRLLAYHSVENIGIIALGLGTGLLGRSWGLPLLAVLGLAGALLHVVNHGIFKSLLFFGAGSIVHATGTREIDRYGGLLRQLPWTGLFFLGGAVAISGLPPLNGFVSEWLIYLGLLQSMNADSLALNLAVFAAPVLALIGALALACFVKVFGATFSGTGRTPESEQVREAPFSMLLPMGVLLAFCLLIGLFPAAAVPMLRRAAADWSGATVLSGKVFASVAPMAAITWTAILLWVILAVSGYLMGRRIRRGFAAGPTWGCGYAIPDRRMQYTSSSFAGMLVDLFRWGLRPDTHGGEVEGVLPEPAEFSTHTPDTVLDRMVLPMARFAGGICTWLRARLQHGISGVYLMYVALTLMSLLAIATWMRG